MKRNMIILVLVGVLVASLTAPAVLHAQDGCGILTWITGCDMQLKQAEAQGNFQLNQQNLNNAAQAEANRAQLEAQAQANELVKQKQQADADYQAALLAAQTDAQRITAQQQHDARVADLEGQRLVINERINAVNANTAFNITALQADTAKTISANQAVVAQNLPTTLLLVLAIVLIVCSSTIAGIWLARRPKPAPRAPLLLPEVERLRMQLPARQQEYSHLLDAQGRPWTVHNGQLAIPQANGRLLVAKDV